MFDALDELARTRLLENLEFALRRGDTQAPGAKRSDKNHFLGALADVDETAGARELGTEFADVKVADLVDLRKPEKGRIQTAAIIEIELVGLVDDGLGVDRGAKIDAACRNAADHAGFGRERDQVDDSLLICDRRNPFGHADAEIDHAIRLQLKCRAAGDNLSFAH